MAVKGPVVLCILDGWGHAEPGPDNAIALARTPNWNALTRDWPWSLLSTDGLDVGLPPGQMGNSEVGHMNIGSGRIIMQELPKIDAAIADGLLAARPAITAMIAALKKSGGACHLPGLVSPGGVHAHQQHIAALAGIVARAGVPVVIHAFLDGRDTPPSSALDYMERFLRDIKEVSGVTVGTVGGRYYAMDRDKRWERVAPAYDAMVSAQGVPASDALSAIAASYADGVTDEFVKPCVLKGYQGMKDGDGLLVANFRADRVREICQALLDPAFNGFARAKTVRFATAAGMVDYSEALGPFMTPVFPSEQPRQTLGELVSAAGKKQLRIAETEKYAHVTFFFNGGREAVFDGEDRILVPSPKVATYDLQPEMSAPEVTDKLVAAIDSGAYALVVANYANTDMVGHTGDRQAAIKAVEAVDACLGRVWRAVAAAGGLLCITADHGNAEKMHDETTGDAHTAHTLNKVPFLLAGEGVEKGMALNNGRLCDIAPTLLRLMGMKAPAAMTGRNLVGSKA